MKALTLITLLLLAGCATTDPEPPPDFYDRAGTPCWRMNDLVWCEDGYHSEGAATSAVPLDTLMTQNYHSHVWQKQSTSTDDHGKQVCTWTCVSDASHIAITSGYGFCSYPY